MKTHHPIRRLLLAGLIALNALLYAGCDDGLLEGEDAPYEDVEGMAATNVEDEEVEIAAFNSELTQSMGAAELGFAPIPVTLDLDAMAQHIQQKLNGNAVGYAYAITQSGQLKKAKGVGWAKRPPDGGEAIKSTTRMNVASVTKNVTAVATLQLLEELGLSIDSKIAKWLPGDWPKGPGISELTFRHLLTHKSGAKQKFNSLSEAQKANWGNTWDGIKYVVKLGMQPDSPSAYKNWNFAVLRVIIPALWKATGNHPGIAWITEASHGFWYVAYVQQRIFVPSGVNGVLCQPQAAYPSALSYNVSNLSVPGKQTSTQLANCGGHGNLHLSARDLARYMVHVRYNNAILSPAMRQLMDSEKLGWNGSSGVKRWHGGTLYLGSGRELLSCIMKYPNNLEATLVINSSETAVGDKCSILKTAYDAALP